MTEKRKLTRHTFYGASVCVKTVLNTEIELVDISLGGALIRGARRYNIGCTYMFKLKHMERFINIKGSVIRAMLSGCRKVAGDAVPIYTTGIHFVDVMNDRGEQLREFISHNQNIIKDPDRLIKQISGGFSPEP